MKHLAFLVDGFNMYHSIEDIESDLGVCYKWLDLFQLCKAFVYLFGREYELFRIYYFTAIAYHYKDDDKVKRHEDYIKCLESTGIEVICGRFKEKSEFCPLCKRSHIGHVEKETDIALCGKMLELVYANDNTHCDGLILVTGDSDLIPGIKTAQKICPSVDIRCAFPYKRKSDDLLKVVPKSFKLRTAHYQAFQFKNPVKLSDGTLIHKPDTWK
jgi:uncharacterized LabA/DUF88 family protein